VCDAEDSREVKITGEPGAGITLSSPFWSPDGAHIAYLSTVQGEKPAWHIRVSDARTGESKTVYQANSVVRLLGWSPDGGLFLATIDGKQGIWPSPARVTLIRVALDQGSARAIATIDSTYLYTTHLSPDGRLIGLVSRQEGKGNIWAVSTQDGKARKLTANNDPKLYFSTLSWSPDSKTIYFDKQSRFSLISIINNFK
jgi:Tol biopolymer transport system component